MALREERARLRFQKPGYGVRSMFGWVLFLALIVLVMILWLSKALPLAMVCAVFALVIGLFIVAAAVTLRVYGHISAGSMLAMIQLGLKVSLHQERALPLLRPKLQSAIGRHHPRNCICPPRCQRSRSTMTIIVCTRDGVASGRPYRTRLNTKP